MRPVGTLAGSNPALVQSYPAIPSSVSAAREAITAFAAEAGAGELQLEAVRLAASEALTNAVVHAYQGMPGRVHTTAAVTDQELWILVSDEGCGLRSGSGGPGLGIGLALIADASDEFSIVRRAGGGTEVWMRWRLRWGGPELD